MPTKSRRRGMTTKLRQRIDREFCEPHHAFGKLMLTAADMREMERMRSRPAYAAFLERLAAESAAEVQA